MKAICVVDNIEFSSIEELEAHEKSGHKIVPDSAKSLANPSLSDPDEFDKTLADMKKYNEAKQAKQAEAPVIEKKEIKLTYRFEGNCATCGRIPSTLMIENEAGYFAIAYCVSDNQQLKSIKVEKLK